MIVNAPQISVRLAGRLINRHAAIHTIRVLQDYLTFDIIQISSQKAMSSKAIG